MKKLVLTSVCTLAVAGAAFAQGTINWTGPSAADYTTQTNSQTISPLFGGGSTGSGAVGATAPTSAGGSFYFELLYTSYTGTGNGFASLTAQPSTVSQLATWTDSGLGGTQGTVAGRNAISAPNGAQVVNWANGTTDSVMLVEWSGNLGTTWSAALAHLEAPSTITGGNAFFGMSATGYINPSTSTTLGATLFSNAAQGTAGTPILSLNTQLYLVPVPEPSTIAMAAFGGLSLLALRRKK